MRMFDVAMVTRCYIVFFVVRLMMIVSHSSSLGKT